MPYPLQHIETAVRNYDADLLADNPNGRRAAVAAILRESNDGVEALFIRRASKEGDPWSGQMAFPGGHKDDTDYTLKYTAERETMEEIGLDLTTHARYVGRLDDVRAAPRARPIDMIVSPHIYVLEKTPHCFDMNYEVADVLWGSLDDMYHGRAQTTLEYKMLGKAEPFPGYQVGDQVVWGLTYRMVGDLFRALDPGFKQP